MVRKPIKFDMENSQFLEIYKLEELETIFKDSVEENLYNPRLWETSMYNADGLEITDNFKKQEGTIGNVRSSSGKAELFLLYVYIAIILGLGIIFTRYFLTD